MHRTKRELEWLEGFFLTSFCDGVESLVYPQALPLQVEGTVDSEPIPFRELSDRSFRNFEEGEQWGQNWDSAWFRLHARVPEQWRGGEVVARLHFGGEACVFDADGEPVQGLTGGSVHLPPFVRDLYRVLPSCEGGEEVSILVEAAANELWGVPKGDIPVTPANGRKPESNTAPVGVIKTARIALFDEQMYQLYFDVTVLYRLMMDLPEDDVQRARIREGLHRARVSFRRDAPDAAETRRILTPLLAMSASGAEPTTICVGHAHLDTAWLWPKRESIRKCCRSFSTQIGLIQRYPEYVFGASQAPHYLFMKEHYPGLYAKIKQAVADGRWEVQGAMWVETDCNVPSGESLVRQLLYGKRFFREEFGVNVRNAWLPDVFGYPASLPQLFKLAEVDFFVTQKLSWNTVNRFPHHTFHWRGIDGSTVFAHLLPMESYNGQLFPDTNRFAARNHEEKGVVPEFLTCFGIGDGGGGASDKHIEFGMRQRDLAGCPQVLFGSAQSQLERLSDYADRVATWDGPLYLERHQGTLTTQARMKLRNRRIEQRLGELELRFAARSPRDYPRDSLRQCWHTLMTNQFHDILPGSSITRVYEDAHRDYDEVDRLLDELEEGLAADEPDIVVFNPHGFEYRGVVQTAQGGWEGVCAPAFATTSIANSAIGIVESEVVTVEEQILENGLIRYEFDERGRLVSALDKETGREVMRADQSGNVITLYEDILGDAWDSDVHYREQIVEHARLVNRRLNSDSPLCGEIETEFQVGDSLVHQTVRLRALSRRLDFVTTVDWRENGRQLRVAFPLNLHAREATAETQFGLQKWPLTSNTTWERAQSDVPVQRFADISEDDFGAAVLNDCKYGYCLKGHTIDLNLLRAPAYPDASADRGEHTFTYALLPHSNRLEDSDVFLEMQVLNQPPRIAPLAGVRLPFTCEANHVIVDGVKRAEDSDDIVLRCYEPRRGRGTLRLRPLSEGMRFFEANLLEQCQDELKEEDGMATAHFSPFEVKTILCRHS